MARSLIAISFSLALISTINQLRAETFFVSSSHGSDLNAGTRQTAPWKTLSKLNSKRFMAGDRILFRRGDTWKGESFKAQKTDEVGWVSIGSFGDGDKPKLWPGYEYPAAIQIGDPQIAVHGGWHIYDLDLGYAQSGILFHNEKSQPRGLRIEDCDIHDIHGAKMFQYPYMHHSTGIAIFNGIGNLANRLSDVSIIRTSISRSDAPVSIVGVNHLVIDELRSSYANRSGLELFEVTDGVVMRSIIEWTGIHGMFWGTAGIGLSKTERVIIKDSEVAHTQNPGGSPDGVGVDFEGSNIDATALRLKIHHNQGSAFLVFKNPDWGSDNIRTNILDCTTAFNGLDDPLRIPAFLRHYHNEANGGVISGNRILKLHPNQPINIINHLPTDDWPLNYVVDRNSISDF